MTKLQGVILGVIIMLVGIFGGGLLWDIFEQESGLRFASFVFGLIFTSGGLVTTMAAAFGALR